MEEVKKLQKSRQLGEYIEESEKILGIAEGGEWDRFKETIECYCDFALELEESGF